MNQSKFLELVNMVDITNNLDIKSAHEGLGYLITKLHRLTTELDKPVLHYPNIINCLAQLSEACYRTIIWLSTRNKMAYNFSFYYHEINSELERARSSNSSILSIYDGLGVIFEEIDEFKDEVRKKKHNYPRMWHELIQIGAMAQRTAEDLKLI